MSNAKKVLHPRSFRVRVEGSRIGRTDKEHTAHRLAKPDMSYVPATGLSSLDVIYLKTGGTYNR